MPVEDFSRLAAAMASNDTFSSRVVEKTTREATIKEGFNAESFDFNGNELAKILEIKAIDQKDFAIKLDAVLKTFYPKTLEDILKRFPRGINF